MNGAIGALILVIAGLFTSYFFIADMVRKKWSVEGWRENGRKFFVIIVMWILAYVFYKYRNPVSHGFGDV